MTSIDEINTCPICGNAVERGELVGNMYTIKWLPYPRKLFLGIWAFGGKSLGTGGIWGRAKIPAIHCSDCKKIVVDS